MDVEPKIIKLLYGTSCKNLTNKAYHDFFRIYYTAWKVSKYEVSLRIQSEWGKYGPKQTPYLDTFHEMNGKPARYYETKKDSPKIF